MDNQPTTGNTGEAKALFGACVMGAGSKRPVVGVIPGTPAAGLHELRGDILANASAGIIPLEDSKTRLIDLGGQLRTGVVATGKPSCPAGAVNTGVSLTP